MRLLKFRFFNIQYKWFHNNKLTRVESWLLSLDKTCWSAVSAPKQLNRDVGWNLLLWDDFSERKFWKVLFLQKLSNHILGQTLLARCNLKQVSDLSSHVDKQPTPVRAETNCWFLPRTWRARTRHQSEETKAKVWAWRRSQSSSDNSCKYGTARDARTDALDLPENAVKIVFIDWK